MDGISLDSPKNSFEDSLKDFMRDKDDAGNLVESSLSKMLQKTNIAEKNLKNSKPGYDLKYQLHIVGSNMIAIKDLLFNLYR